MTTVLLPRPTGSDADAGLFERLGISVIADPYIETFPILDEASMRARRELAARMPASALVVTSVRALSAFLDFCEAERTGIVFAIGAASAAAARAAGFGDVRMPDDGAHNVALTRLIASAEVSSVVIPRSTAAPMSLTEDLRALGIEVHDARLYSTGPVEQRPESAAAIERGEIDAVIVRSGSAARALAQFVQVWPGSTAIVAGGKPTATVLREVGLPVSAIAEHPDADCVVSTTLTVLGLGGTHD